MSARRIGLVAGLSGSLRGLLLGGSTILLLVALALLPFLNPVWLGIEQDRADAAAWTGWPRAEVRRVTDALLHDLVIGPPDFVVAAPDGRPAFDERERSHMRDVRVVFSGVLGGALVAALLLVAAAATVRRRDPDAFWGPVGTAGAVTGLLVVGLGIVFGVAFDAAFEVFHRLFFPAGTYAFDPTTSRLVQLLPEALWYETSLAFGAVLLLLGTGTWALAHRATR